MRHAGQEALDRLEPLLAAVRRLPGLKERSRGIFYKGATAFLHFHEDPAGLFADMKVGAAFERHDVSDATRQKAFAKIVKSAVA